MCNYNQPNRHDIEQHRYRNNLNRWRTKLYTTTCLKQRELTIKIEAMCKC